MSKWKCEICGGEFENFHAQGFNHKIYCPLCYFKELYRQTELERERLNNIINELEKWLEEQHQFIIEIPAYTKEISIEHKTMEICYENALDKLKELKENNKC